MKLNDTGADGFIPARTLGSEFFRYEENRHAMVGERSGETYQLGQTVEVKLVEAIPAAGALRFEMLSEGRRDMRSRHKQDARGKSGGKSRYQSRGKPTPGDRKGRHRRVHSRRKK